MSTPWIHEQVMQVCNIKSVYVLARILKRDYGVEITDSAINQQKRNRPTRVYQVLVAYSRMVGGWENLGAIIESLFSVKSPPIAKPTLPLKRRQRKSKKVP